jgi:hypothetical protein
MKRNLLTTAAVFMATSAMLLGSGWVAPVVVSEPEPEREVVVEPAKGSRDNRQVSESNPTAPSTRASVKAADVSVDQIVKRAGKTHAGADLSKSVVEQEVVNSGFMYPYVSVDYGYTSNQDERLHGIDADVHNVTLTGGFTTFWDLNVGGMFDFSNSTGSSDTMDSSVDTFTGSVFVSRMINNWSLAGVSLSYSASDSQLKDMNDVDTDTYTVSPFVSFFKTIGSWTLSFTPTYSLSFADIDYNIDGVGKAYTTNGTFLATVKAAYAVTEKLTLALTVTPTMLVQQEEASADAAEGDDFWMSLAPSASYKITEALSATVGYKYDAFNGDYENHNVTAGLNYAF